MASARPVELKPGSVYRTAALRRWGDNPTRLATRLEREGRLQRLGHGLFYAPKKTRFGTTPPTDDALLDAFLDGTPYVVSGPPLWNALGLGTTGVAARRLVYNTKRSGSVTLAGRTFDLRRVAFPEHVTPEWYVVDLLRNSDAAGVDRNDLLQKLAVALERGRFDEDELLGAAQRFGLRDDTRAVRRAIQQAHE